MSHQDRLSAALVLIEQAQAQLGRAVAELAAIRAPEIKACGMQAYWYCTRAIAEHRSIRAEHVEQAP